ncbi:MAG: electron transfer flavoprotein subunit beta/FixA family protein [Pseudomonadota bacterium]
MRVLTPVKRVIDYNISPRVKADGSGVDLTNVKMSMNPFDEIAVEEAVRMKERGDAAEVVAVSIGPAKSEDTLRVALALGADRAILIDAGDAEIEPLAVAKLLKAVVEEVEADLVLCGKQAIDGDMNATGQMLAALLGWPQATNASDIRQDGAALTVTREVDGGVQDVAMEAPAVISVDLRLNEPRYASLPNIMRAKKKPLDKRAATDFGVDLTPRLTAIETVAPPERQAGQMVADIPTLVAKLKDEARVI